MRRMSIISALAAGAGAALMYLSDPDRGNARRAFVRDRTLHLARSGWRSMRNSALGASNHARGAVAELQARTSSVHPSDEVLVEHVRAEMGHVIRHPHRVVVTADAGWIELRGDILPDEKPALLRAIRRIPGVFGVQEQLDEHGWIGAQAIASGAS